MGRKTGVYPGRKLNTWSVVLTDKTVAQYSTKEEAERMLPIHKEQHRKEAMANLRRIRTEQMEARHADPSRKLTTTSEGKREYMRKYRAEHREELNEKSRIYREQNQERIKGYEKERRAKARGVKPKVARAANSAPSAAPRQPKAWMTEKDSNLRREQRAHEERQKLASGELKKLSGSIEDAKQPIDPNRPILRTDHLPSFSWSRNHFER